MSTDLLTQLADYGRYHQDEQEPVDLTQIVGEGDAVRTLPPEEPSTPDRQPARMWWAAVAAAAVILLLVGGAAWVSRLGGTSGPADQPSTTAPPTTVSSDPAAVGEIQEWLLLEPTFDGSSPTRRVFTDAASTPFGLFAATFPEGVWTTDDGVEWARVASESLQFDQESFNRLGGSGLGLVLIGPRNGSWFSPDARQWTRLPDDVFAGSLQDFNSIAASERGFLVGAGNSLWFSPDGLSWALVPGVEPVQSGWPPVAATGEAFYYASGSRETSSIWRSDNGVTWTLSLELPSRLVDLAASDVGVVAIADDATIWYSPDGKTWTPRTDVFVPQGEAAELARWWKVGASVDGFLIASFAGTEDQYQGAWFSPDGLTWAPTPLSVEEGVFTEHRYAYSIVPFNNGFIAVGDDISGQPERPSVWIYTP